MVVTMRGDLFNEVQYQDQSRGSRPSMRRSPDRPEHVKRVHAGFGLLGFGLGVAAAVYGYNESSSIALAIFLFLVVQGYIARGLGDVATDPQKGKRFVYFTLQPLVAVGVLVLTYQWWGIMWLAVVLGLVVGAILWGLVGTVLFPKIAEEETEDTKERMTEGLS